MHLPNMVLEVQTIIVNGLHECSMLEETPQSKKEFKSYPGFFFSFQFSVFISFYGKSFYIFFILHFCTFFSSSAMSAAKNHKISHFSLILVAIIKSTEMIRSSITVYFSRRRHSHWIQLPSLSLVWCTKCMLSSEIKTFLELLGRKQGKLK